MFIKPQKGSAYEKRWVAVFTCFTTRAIHLELVSDCSSNAAIRAIERFIGRRGTPSVLLSDIQTAFLKAAKMLSRIWQKADELDEGLAAFFSREGIIWKTIPERAPWYNGLTERLVGLVKRALKKILWRASIDSEVLQTLLIKIEGMLNSRPLLSSGADFGDGAVLTPAHFIAPGTYLGLPPLGEDPKDPDFLPNPRLELQLLGIWKTNNHRLDQFHKIWSSQYLQELREFHRSHFPPRPGEIARTPVPKEICLARQPPQSRLAWPLVQVLELLPAKEGEVRYVKVRLPSGVVTRRAVQDLIPLEASLESKGQEKSTAANGEQEDVKDRTSAPADQVLQGFQGPLTRSRAKAALFSVFLVFLCMPLGSAIHTLVPPMNSTYQICLHAPGGKLVSLQKPNLCVVPPRKPVKTTNVTLFVPSSHWPNSSASLCYKETVQVCTKTSFWGEVGLPQKSVWRKPATTEECQIASNRFLFNQTALRPVSKAPGKLYSTQNQVKVRSSWWSTVCSQATNFIMELGEVASRDGLTISSNLQGTEDCILAEGHCVLPTAVLIWSLRSITSFCPFQRKGIYPARFSDQFITIPQLHASYELTSVRGFSLHHCIPKQAYLTKGGSVIFWGVHVRNLAEELKDSISADDIPTELGRLQSFLEITDNEDAKMNQKLNYLVSFLDRTQIEQFQKEHLQFCLIEQRLWYLNLQMIQMNPTHGIRAALGRDDLTAEFRGDRLFVHQCHQVKVDTIYLDHKHPETGLCHTFLPVKAQEKVWFLIPGTRDLVSESPPLLCSLVEHSHVSHHEISQINIHSTLIFPKQHNVEIKSFSGPALYRARQYFPPVALQSFVSGIPNSERRLSALINYTSFMSWDASDIRNALAGIGEGAGAFFGEVISAFGDATGTVIHETLTGLGAFASSLLTPLYILILSIVVGLIALAVIFPGIWKIWAHLKTRFFHSGSNPASASGSLMSFTLTGVQKRLAAAPGENVEK